MYGPSVCRDYFSGSISAVSGAAADRSVSAAVVRGDAGGVDDLHVVFSGVFAGWVCVCSLAQRASHPSASNSNSHWLIGRIPVIFADFAQRRFQAERRRHPCFADTADLCDNGGVTVLAAGGLKPADPGMVCSVTASSQSVSALCVVQCRITAGPGDVPICV